MQYRKGQCVECPTGTENVIVNRSRMLCHKHNEKRLDLESSARKKRSRIPSRKKPVYLWRKPKEPTGELPLFREIVLERGSRSQISGEPIPDITVSSMIHVLSKAKNKFPKFKLYKKCIIIGTPEEHHAYDHGSIEALRKNPQWKWVFDLREELITEYKEFYG